MPKKTLSFSKIHANDGFLFNKWLRYPQVYFDEYSITFVKPSANYPGKDLKKKKIYFSGYHNFSTLACQLLRN